MDKNHYAVQYTIIAQMVRLLEIKRFAFSRQIFLRFFHDKKLPFFESITYQLGIEMLRIWEPVEMVCTVVCATPIQLMRFVMG